MIGNSSAGVREAPHFGVPAINLGSRQNNRVRCISVINAPIEESFIKRAIDTVHQIPHQVLAMFGDGGSAEKFQIILCSSEFWQLPTQKYFVDR